MNKCVLSIAASDVLGHSGIEADIRTITAMGAKVAVAIPAFLCENAQPQVLPSDLVLWQVRHAIEKLRPSVIKLGRVYSAETVDDLYALLSEFPDEKRRLVIGLTCGGKHINSEEIASMKRNILLKADLVVLGVPEVEMLTGYAVHDMVGLQHAAAMMLTLGVHAVLIKGSDAVGQDIFANETLTTMYPLIRPHDACMFDSASAVSCLMSDGMDVADAVRQLCVG
ncbi:MAG TPA: hypothetical protein DCW68_02940 [Rhodospirillaceae bacterium]|nr:MAG: hypothetical protein A2018_05915 [Alphaproteobacteria bacterium GWF2_58_20]HAU29048.1 hypothetical protein [Rhodospirillaceae bacterium]